jgi:hypothetical protein
LDEDGFGLEEPVVPVERCEKEGGVAGSVVQEAEVFLLCINWVRKTVRDGS